MASNDEGVRVSIRQIVNDPQFRSGYRDQIAGLPPPPFYFDPRAGKGEDTWGYERGRLLATWLIATGQELPGARDIDVLAGRYIAALGAGVML